MSDYEDVIRKRIAECAARAAAAAPPLTPEQRELIAAILNVE